MTQSNEKTGSKTTRRMPLHRQPFFVILIILAIVAVVVIVALLINNQGKESNLPEDADSATEESPDPIIETNDTSGDKKVVQYEGEDPNESEDITGIVTYAGVENGDFTVSTMIDQYITGGGDCTLTLTNSESGESYTATSDLVADVTTSYCGDLVVSADDLSSGAYQIEIIVEGGDKKGTIKSEVNL